MWHPDNSQTEKDEKGFFKCKTPNCYVCKFAEPMKSIKSRNRQERIEIEIKSRLDCESKNLLYRIKYQKCGIEYVRRALKKTMKYQVLKNHCAKLIIVRKPEWIIL